jgi:hypothetical protein
MNTSNFRRVLNAVSFLLANSSASEFYMPAFIIIQYLFTAIGLSPGGSGYFTGTQILNLVTTKFKSGELHEKHVVATWSLGNHLIICF